MRENAELLTDIRLVLQRADFRPVYTVDTDRRRVSTQQGQRVLDDLGKVSGRDNLGQAVMLRLLTPRGELEALAHPEYGSRLHELVGRPNNENTRNLIKLHILEALQREARIEEVLEVVVRPVPGTRDRVDVRLAVRPVRDAEVLDLGPFTLEL